MATSDVGSAALCFWDSRTRVSAPHELVSCASGFPCCGLRCLLGRAFFGPKVFRKVIQQGAAIGVGDDRPQAFHFVEFVRPFFASHVLLGDAARVMTRGASGLHFGLHGSGRKRFAWSAGRLRARRNDRCEQKDCWKKSLEQGGFPFQFSVFSFRFSVLSSQFSVLSSQFSVLSSQFSVLRTWMCFAICGCYFFGLVCDVDWVALFGAV
jgi:hypothetical protein